MKIPDGSGQCIKEMDQHELHRKIDKLVQSYQDKPGALIPILQVVQGMFGYLPKNAIKRICLGLDKSYSEVAGVIGFYSFFSTIPRGKNVIRVCLGTACYVRRGTDVLNELKRKLHIDIGETTHDKLFSLEIARCFGACGLAPVITINDTVYQRVKPSKIQEILDIYRENETQKQECTLDTENTYL